MANPQAEHGYTRIANELIEALCITRIPGEQMQCLLVIIRKTYGYNRKEAMITNTEFHKATGIDRSHVCRALNSLEERKIIVAKKGNKKALTYQFNKDYEKWKVLPKKAILPKMATTIAKNGNKSPSAPIICKDNIKTDIYTSKFESFWKAYPKKVGKKAAARAFKTAKDLPGIDTLIAIIEKHKSSRQWKEGFIPNPATWLNQGRWEDEIESDSNACDWRKGLYDNEPN